MGRPIQERRPALESYKLDMSHQEVDRLITELETMYNTFAYTEEGPTGVEWLPVEGVATALCGELGYEDVDELEDALHGTFSEFLECLPNIEKKVEEREGKEREYFKILPEPPREAWKDTRWTLKVESTKDLWRVCMKSPYARIEIPELEFEISQDGKRKIDSIYNHIGSAVYNLGNYVSQAKDSLSEDHADKILDTVMELNKLLDVEKPFTWIVHDPSGLSDLKPSTGVEVVHPEATDAEAQEAAA